MKKSIYCLIGPSGSGKTRTAHALTELGIPEIVSHTTRKPREGEIEGTHYYFISDEEYEAIEKAEFANYGKSKYCISKKELDSKFEISNKLIAVVEINGFKQLKENCSKEANVISIYIKTDLETMRKRMAERNDKPEDIEFRLNNAIKTNEFDNEHIADYVVDNRGNFETTMSEIRKIIGI